MAAVSTAAVSTAALSGSSCVKRRPAAYIGGLNLFSGLKAHSSVASLGMPMCSEQSFAAVVNSLKGKRGSSRGGALSSTCNAAAEIFKIAAIMNGLVLIGVAVGFVLLRIEATLEESE